MSKLRPEVGTGGNYPCIKNGTAYYAIYNAVNEQDGLIHGRLHSRGAHCAIGSFWETNPNTSLPEDIVDEVAAVNDSMPSATPRQRKLRVQRWLRWKLQQLGMSMPGPKAAPR